MNETAIDKKPERTPNIDNMTLSEIQEKNLAHLMFENRQKRIYKKRDNRFKLGKSISIKKASVQDKTWYSVTHWHKKLEREWSELKPNQRAHYSVELIKLLVSKLNTIPVDQKDSIDNASATLSMIKSLESISDKLSTTATTESKDKTTAESTADCKLQDTAVAESISVVDDKSRVGGESV